MNKIVPVVLIFTVFLILMGVGGFAHAERAELTEALVQIDKLSMMVTDLQNQVDMLQATTAEQHGYAGDDLNIQSAIEKAEPSVVKIQVNGGNFKASGSGFIIAGDGYILTNNHVIDFVSSVTIEIDLMDGEKYYASVLATDKARDLAVLKINSSKTDFPYLELGSIEGVSAGQQVIAAGFPIGLELSGPATFTGGIVSTVRDISGFINIQTDAALNSGNSGGPLIGLNGEVLGICTGKVYSTSGSTIEGIGLALAVDEAVPLIQKAREIHLP